MANEGTATRAYHRWIAEQLSKGATVDTTVSVSRDREVIGVADFYTCNGATHLGSVPVKYYHSYLWLGGEL